MGGVGGRIVGEVFFGLIEGDPNPFMAKEPDWKPRLTSCVENNFKMGNLPGSWARSTRWAAR